MLSSRWFQIDATCAPYAESPPTPRTMESSQSDAAKVDGADYLGGKIDLPPNSISGDAKSDRAKSDRASSRGDGSQVGDGSVAGDPAEFEANGRDVPPALIGRQGLTTIH